MSIDWLIDLERDIDNGKDIYAVQGTGRNQFIIGRSVEDLQKQAKKSANNRKLAVQIVKLVSKSDALAGNLYLVPTSIDEPGPRGEPSIKWSTVETKEAAEMMRDVRRGPAPYFAMQVEENVAPDPGIA